VLPPRRNSRAWKRLRSCESYKAGGKGAAIDSHWTEGPCLSRDRHDPVRLQFGAGERLCEFLRKVIRLDKLPLPRNDASPCFTRAYEARPEGLEPPTLGSEEAPGQPAKKLESRYRESAYHEGVGVANRLIPSYEIPRKRGKAATNPVITGFAFWGVGGGNSAGQASGESSCLP